MTTVRISERYVDANGRLTPAGYALFTSFSTAGAPASHTHPSTDISDSTAAGRAVLTAADATAQTALFDVFTGSAKGLVPASGGGTDNFLRADGAWTVPSVAGGTFDLDDGDASGGAAFDFDEGGA